MAKKQNNWREETKRIIRSYPALLREEAEIHDSRITPSLSGMPGAGGVSRKTENIAMKELPPGSQRELTRYGRRYPRRADIGTAGTGSRLSIWFTGSRRMTCTERQCAAITATKVCRNGTRLLSNWWTLTCVCRKSTFFRRKKGLK